MELKIKVFAALREKAGSGELRMPWLPGMTESDVIGFLKHRFAELSPLIDRSVVAVNGEFAERYGDVRPEDEVAVLPPVSGG